jgi:hypothetical protein
VSLADGTVLDTKTATFDVKSTYIAPPKETSITLTPQDTAVLASSDNVTIISFPAGAAIADVTVTLKPFALENLPTLPAGAQAGGTCFEVDGLSGLLSKDATISVRYSDADLAVAGGDASKLVLARYDSSDNKWTLLNTNVNRDTTTLSATTNRFSTWAVVTTSSPLAGRSGIPAPLDATPALLSLGLIVVIFGVGKRGED